MTQSIDSARLTLILNELRLPAIKQDWATFAERADKESWPAARLLSMLAEHEVAERDRRRLARHLVEAQLLPGKTLDSFDFDAVPMISKAHVLALCAGDSWIGKGANLLLIGGPGGGKTHLASAIGLALVENGFRVLFAHALESRKLALRLLLYVLGHLRFFNFLSILFDNGAVSFAEFLADRIHLPPQQVFTLLLLRTGFNFVADSFTQMQFGQPFLL